jgi:hypothetical protein
MGKSDKWSESGWLRLAFAVLVAISAVFFAFGQMSDISSALGQSIRRQDKKTQELCSVACDLNSRSKTLSRQVDKHKASFEHVSLMNADLQRKIDNRYAIIEANTEILKLQIAVLRNETLGWMCGIRRDLVVIGEDIERVRDCARHLRTNINLPSIL